jgi:flagellar FliL protein
VKDTNQEEGDMPDKNVEADAEDLLEEELLEEGLKKKGGLMAPLLVALAALGGGGAAGALFLGPTVVAPMLVSDPSEKPKEDKGGGGGHGGGGHGEPVTNLVSVENLVVNPAGSEGSRFLLVSVALELADPGMVDAILARDVELRDALILSFGTKTVAELADISRRAALIAEVKGALDHIVGDGVITKVFLPQYVIQ